VIESLHVERRCWRKAVRETQTGLQITLHDGHICPGPKQEPGRYAVVTGYPLRARLDADCSGGRLKQVQTVRCLYTGDEHEAEAAYQDMVACAQGRRTSTREEQVAPVCPGTVEAAIKAAREDGQDA